MSFPTGLLWPVPKPLSRYITITGVCKRAILFGKNLRTELGSSSEMSAKRYQSPRCHIPQDRNIHLWIHTVRSEICCVRTKRCLKWFPPASIKVWTRLILFANTFCRYRFGKSLCTYKRCWKWYPRASIQAWTSLIKSTYRSLNAQRLSERTVLNLSCVGVNWIQLAKRCFQRWVNVLSQWTFGFH
jgi:hypothetical protein